MKVVKGNRACIRDRRRLARCNKGLRGLHSKGLRGLYIADPQGRHNKVRLVRCSHGTAHTRLGVVADPSLHSIGHEQVTERMLVRGM